MAAGSAPSARSSTTRDTARATDSRGYRQARRRAPVARHRGHDGILRVAVAKTCLSRFAYRNPYRQSHGLAKSSQSIPQMAGEFTYSREILSRRQVKVDPKSRQFGKPAIGRQDIQFGRHGGGKPGSHGEIGAHRGGRCIDTSVFEHGTPWQFVLAKFIEHRCPERTRLRHHRDRQRPLAMRNAPSCADPDQAINRKDFAAGRPRQLLNQRDIDLSPLEGSRQFWRSRAHEGEFHLRVGLRVALQNRTEERSDEILRRAEANRAFHATRGHLSP